MRNQKEPKTAAERKDRSIYISRRVHADQLAAKAELREIDEQPDEYTQAELDAMIARYEGERLYAMGISPEVCF